MARIAHAAAALALIALAAACLIGLAAPVPGAAADGGPAGALAPCQTILCMFAVS